MYFLSNWFVKLTGLIPQLLVFRLKIRYEDKSIQDRRIKGKAIVIGNHHALLDFAVLLFVFWRRTLRCQVAEVMYRKNFLMTFFLKAMGAVRVDRDIYDFSFLRKSEEILEKGGVVEVYPESRIPQKGEEKPLPFKPSVAYLALHSGAPIIPVYHTGNYFRKERVGVMIGKPVDVREWYDDALSEKDNLENISAKLRERMIELGNEFQRQTQKEKVR